MSLDARRRRYARQSPRPLSARRLATLAGVAPTSGAETRKRRVRELIEDLRRGGVPIVAVEGGAGYWIAETPDDHALYQEALRNTGVARLVKAHADRRSGVRSDTAGQLGLFATASRSALIGA